MLAVTNVSLRVLLLVMTFALLAALASPAQAGVWRPAIDLPAGASNPKPIVLPDGSVVAMWAEEAAADGCDPYTTDPGCEVRSAILGADGTWSDPVVLSTGDASRIDSQLIVDAEGTVTAVWLQTDGGSSASSVHARRLVDGTWSGAERLSATGLEIYSIALAVNDDGEVLAVWSDAVADSIASRLHAGGAWQASASVPSGAGVLDVVEAAVALPDASFIASFRRVIGGYDRVGVARFAGGAWVDEGNRSTVVDASNTYTLSAGLTVDGAGTVTLAMQAFDRVANRYFIEVDRRVAGVWAGRTAIPQTSHHEQAPQVVAGPDGIVTMAWQGFNADFSSGEVVRSARLSAGAWTALPDLGTGTRAFLPNAGGLVLDPQGDPQILIDLWDATVSRWPTSLVTWNGSGWSAPVAMAPTAGWRVSRLVYGAGGVGAMVGQDWPAAVSARVHAVAPGTPRSVRGEAGDGTARVAWETPASFGGSPISGYTVTADPGGRTCTTTGALACTVDGLANGTPYRFTATATNAAGTGVASTSSDPVTPTGAPAPTPDPAPVPTPEMRTPQLPRTGPPTRVRIPVEVPSAGTLRVIGMSHHRRRVKPVWRCTFEVAVEEAGTVPARCRLRARARNLLKRGPVRFTFVAVHRSLDGVVTETRSTVTMGARRAR